MGISTTDVLAVADGLAALQGEANLRSATSRFFYAAFHSAGAWQDQLPGHASGLNGYAGGTHQDLINKLRNPDNLCSAAQKQKSKLMAPKLEVLRMRRVVADYKLTAVIPNGEYPIQQAQAKALVADCANP